MSSNPATLILLSTYNGAKYLPAQLDSIIAQTHPNWTLLVRDDGSRDDTLTILQQYASKDGRIILLQDKLGNLNVIKSFAALMNAAIKRDEEYLFFCDQDDVWLPHKIQTTLNLLQQIETQNGADKPTLVHTDLRVVDKDLNTIHDSYLRFEGLKRNPEQPLNTLLINNYITGCTIGMNRALLKLATPVPDEVRMHDWWCGLCAAAMGTIGFIDEATILYRQHGNNSVGSSGFYGKLKELKSVRQMIRKRQKNFIACFEQATHLHKRVNNQESSHLITSFIQLPEKNIIARYLSATKLYLQPAGITRLFAFWAILLFI